MLASSALLLLIWALPFSDGQCNIDLTCNQVAAGCTLADGFPFQRLTPTTCDECVKLCAKFQQGQFPYICKSAVWDCKFKTCDLFAVRATSPQRLTKYKDRTYFQPSGARCGADSGPSSTATPGVSDCPAGQRAILSIFQNSTNSGLQGKQVNAPTAEKCGLLCVQNQDDQGQPLQCAAAQFTQGKCTLSAALPPGDPTKSIQPAAGDPSALYLEKRCFPNDQAKGCSSIVLDPHHVLVGQNRKTVTASSYDQCLQQCLATTEFKCLSGQYFADVSTENCVLNEETRSTKPELYLAADDNNIYFEPKCGTSRKLIFSVKKVKAKLSMKDIPLENGDWTLWTECKNGEKEKHRYKNCKETRIYNCPKQTAPCTPNDQGDKDGFISNLINEENCIPVQMEVENGKKKRCDLGYQYHANGTRTYCVPKKRPEDCIDLSVIKRA